MVDINLELAEELVRIIRVEQPEIIEMFEEIVVRKKNEEVRIPKQRNVTISTQRVY